MTTGARLREAETRDAESIAQVHIRSWQGAYRGQLSDEFLDTLESSLPERQQMWAKAISEGLPPLVAEIDDELVGFVSCGPSRDPFAAQSTAEIYAIYLLPQVWDRGIGKALHDDAIKRLRMQGFTEATLWVLDTNKRTIRWYQRQGWEPDGSSRVEELAGAARQEIRYAISL